MMKSFIKSGLILLTFIFAGCLDKYPDNAIPDKDAIKTVANANQAVIGIYANFKSSALYSGYLTLLPDIQADLVYAVEGFSNVYGDIWRWEILSTNPEIQAVYGSLYSIIGRCNYFFESIVHLEKTLTDDDQLDQLQSLKGEVHFARALAYSELIKSFCKAYDPATAEDELGVALISSYYTPERMVRSSLKDSYAFVLSDLEKASEMVTLDKKNNSPYITKSVVNALYSRVYLYMQDWDKAVEYSTKVIDDKYLGLSSTNVKNGATGLSFYQYMWKYDNASEIIWKIAFTTTSYGGALGRVFLNYDNISYKPDYVPANWALGLYEKNDLRATTFFAQKTTGYAHGLTWPLLVKYNGNEDFLKLNIRHVNMPKVFRLSEQYLIRAEANSNLGNYANAAKDITTLRSARYSSYGSTTINEDNWLKLISEERVRELFMEGFRLHDLKRWNKGFKRTPQSSTVGAGNSLNIEAGNPLFVWPIPQHDLDAPGSELQPNDSNK
ncbi:hypothetical protein SDC9_99013 [bioreactor metagenome]|uniref:SusD-like protein n=1 Tax=bioreactor metagenome TaxID=1076179 RepID=A0A645AH28_9ZZZZ